MHEDADIEKLILSPEQEQMVREAHESIATEGLRTEEEVLEMARKRVKAWTIRSKSA